MCRIFGFRSVIQSQVHHSLVEADNALHLQSEEHRDGWGVSYYVNGSPHIVKSEKTALEDTLFQKVSGVVASETVLAHIRRATRGQLSILNTHPFQHGQWVFAHNGNIKSFNEVRDELISKIAPQFRRFILGETDSEVLFYFILTHLVKDEEAYNSGLAGKQMEACKKAMDEIEKVVGPMLDNTNGPTDDNYLTFLLTNGQSMLAHQGGKELYYSTYKKKCGERDTCPSFAPECEAPSETGFVNHMIFSSEPLSGENIWHPLKFKQVMGVDSKMKVFY